MTAGSGTFADRLAARLTQSLPGRAAQRQFLPDLSFGRYFHLPPTSARRAAVMVLHYPLGGRWMLPLTVRPLHLKDHGGQISFPGGAIESGETPEQAAIRELHEELRGTSTQLHVVDFVPNPDEVAELLEIPLATLLDESNYGRHLHEFGRRSPTHVDVGHIQHQTHRIWGATAIMLGELIQVLKDVLE